MLFSRFRTGLALGLLFLLFQNFTYDKDLFPRINADKALRRTPASVEKDARPMIAEMERMRALERPEILPPEGGHDLNSVAADWAQRQGHLWLNGADQRLVASLNERLHSWLGGDSKEDGKAAPPTTGAATGDKKSSWQNDLHFTRVNSVRYDMEENTRLTLHLEGDGGHIDYVRDLGKNARLNLEHQAANNQTRLSLRYEW